jgi:hypothetical protein
MKAFLSLCLVAATGFSAQMKLGKPLTLKQQIAIDKLVAAPERYVGKMVQVKGSVRDVCQHMGCWMELLDPATNKGIRIKVEDGVIVFPPEAVGKTAIAEGKLAKLVLTKEQAIAQAQHEAEMNQRKFDPASITSGRTLYQIEGSGAVILE